MSRSPWNFATAARFNGWSVAPSSRSAQFTHMHQSRLQPLARRPAYFPGLSVSASVFVLWHGQNEHQMDAGAEDRPEHQDARW
jgi:hypothetical protein